MDGRQGHVGLVVVVTVAPGFEFFLYGVGMVERFFAIEGPRFILDL